jgi:hypothetical protein
MWTGVRGMRISKGDDTSPVENDRISFRRCAASPAGDLLASPNFGICDPTPFFLKIHLIFFSSEFYEEVYTEVEEKVSYIFSKSKLYI